MTRPLYSIFDTVRLITEPSNESAIALLYSENSCLTKSSLVYFINLPLPFHTSSLA